MASRIQLFKYNVTLAVSASSLFLNGEIVSPAIEKACSEATLVSRGSTWSSNVSPVVVSASGDNAEEYSVKFNTKFFALTFSISSSNAENFTLGSNNEEICEDSLIIGQ
ncbi:unnamed protein product [Rhizophagus irregularis]|nr:unnamed protein product [Rhizophagus irregularis]